MKRRKFIQRTALASSASLLTSLGYELSAGAKKKDGSKKKILLRSSWQTINIGDIAHTPGFLALCEKYLPDVEVQLWAGSVDRDSDKMLLRRFPNLKIIARYDEERLKVAFDECDFFVHGSGAYLVAARDVKRWVKETGKPFGVYGITLPESKASEEVIALLDQARFIFFRDSVSLEIANIKGIKAPIMEFGPDATFGIDVKNDKAAVQFMSSNGLEEGKFLCAIPRYRKTPNWTIPSKNADYDAYWDNLNQSMKEHDHKPYREAIIAVVRRTPMKVLICPEDVTQAALGKEMLYDPLPEDVKEKVVLRQNYWITDEALSTYMRSAGLFGLEMHSPIMCIANGIPAFVGRFKEQFTKGFMWNDISLSEWLFDSDSEFDMENLVPSVLWMANNPKKAKEKALEAKRIVERRQEKTMRVLGNELSRFDKK